MKISKNPNKNWQNNEIQFARLIAEMEMTGVFTKNVLHSLSKSMDLTGVEICEILTRAQVEWDKIKSNT